jgi:hypothetical protein
MRDASLEEMKSMLIEMLAGNAMLRSAAPGKHVFDDAIDDLKRWIFHDGWIVEGTDILRITPMAEEVTGVRDKLLEDLDKSGLDNDTTIRALLDYSSKDFVAQPPDFNGSITKARIAFETVARRAAREIALTRNADYSEDSWGKALQLLNSQEVIDPREEKILSQVYTFISPGAHIPKGITAEEWARLARTFAVSSTYFLLQKFMTD